MVATRPFSFHAAAASTAAGLLIGGGGIAAYSWWYRSMHTTEKYKKNFTFSTLKSASPRARFHRYATRNIDGEDMLDPIGLIACICLFDENGKFRIHEGQDHQLPPYIRQCLDHAIELIDIDNNRAISYEEFCILFTLLSVSHKNLKMAFSVFAKNEDNCLSKHEFRHMLNALMVDPSVRILKLQPSSKHSEQMIMMTNDNNNGNGNNGTVHMKEEGTKKSETKQLSTSAIAKDVLLSSPLCKQLFGPHGDKRVSFDEFWRLVRELRRRVLAVEFSLHDPRNTGQISLNNFIGIFFRGLNTEANGKEENHKMQTNMRDEEGRFVSWEFFMKVFDILSEYDTISHGMNLILKAKAREGSTTTLLDPQQQGQARDEKQQEEVLPKSKEKMMMSSPSLSDCISGVDTAEFYRVLGSCNGLSHLTRDDAESLMRIFDVDKSGKLSPAEFEQMCELRTTFFTPRQPRFNEARRNKLQQFVFCMQQLK